MTLEFSYQPSRNINEVNRQLAELTDRLRSNFLAVASAEAVDAVELKVISEEGNLADIQAQVSDSRAKVGMLATFNTATGSIEVSAGLIDGIERSDITLSGDQITLNGNTTIGSGFTLSASNIDATNLKVAAANVTGQLVSSQIASKAITADKISVSDLYALGATIGGWEIDSDSITSYDSYIQQASSDGRYYTRLSYGQLLIDAPSATTEINGERAKFGNAVEINNVAATRDAYGNYKLITKGFIVNDTANFNSTTNFNSTVNLGSNAKVGSYSLTTFSKTLGDVSSSGVKCSGDLNAYRIVTDKATFESLITGSGSDMVCSATGHVHIKTSSGSTKRIKHNISTELTPEMDPHKLYDIPIKRFNYNTDYVSDPEDPLYDTPLIGFIAEDIDEIYPIACRYNEKKEVAGWDANFIIPPMLKLIQEQNERIKELENGRQS